MRKLIHRIGEIRIPIILIRIFVIALFVVPFLVNGNIMSLVMGIIPIGLALNGE